MNRWIEKCPLSLRWAGGTALLIAALAYQPAISQSTGFSLPYTGDATSSGAVVSFTNDATSGAGSDGLYAFTNSTDAASVGVYGTSQGGSGVYGYANSVFSTAGVYGLGDGNSGYGVYGLATNNYGVYGTTSGANSNSVISAAGVYGTGSSSTAVGVVGSVNSGYAAIFGTNTGSGVGVNAQSTSSFGVFGGTTGVNNGSIAAAGVYGGSNTATGVVGGSGSGTDPGVYGYNGNTTASSGYGVYGLSANSQGVYGSTNSATAAGLYGVNTNAGAAVIGMGNSANSPAGYFLNNSTYGNATGLQGQCNQGLGVTGIGRVGVYGVVNVSGGYAGYFQGNVQVTGTITGAAKNFKIDHPLDPANKYLAHSCIESSEMINLYRGNVVLDSDGRGTVAMPDWFQAENREFSYQLTAIGASAPDLYISQEMDHNRFEVAGGKPGLKVSWQVTGTRQDAYAAAHPLQVEQDKADGEKGKYLDPVDYGKPVSEGIGALPVNPARFVAPAANPPRLKLPTLPHRLIVARPRPVKTVPRKRQATHLNNTLKP